ncbi:MAG: phage tail tube protein [Planctomycetota bacterium]|jgi:hypothetical protein|nr:phage tail tube protein [Planctomycetota bacterium]
MAHPRRVAGIIFVKIDGEQVPARGSFEFRLSGVQNETVDNADGTTGIGGAFHGGYIKGTLSNYNSIDLRKFREMEGVTVTLELANDKVVIAKDAYQVDEMAVNVETGEAPIQFDSDNVEEMR